MGRMAAASSAACAASRISCGKLSATAFRLLHLVGRARDVPSGLAEVLDLLGRVALQPGSPEVLDGVAAVEVEVLNVRRKL